MSQTRHIGLIANDGKPGAREVVQSLVREFAKHPVQLHLDNRAGRLVGAEHSLTEPEMAEMCELLVVLGGDGTILQALHALGDTVRPLLGINLGTLGFLTTVSAADHLKAVSAIVKREYSVSERSLLKVQIIREGRVTASRIALNDAVVSRGELSRLIRLSVKIDGAELTEYNADGLIVATPTGSTAYSLSAGGPVLAPESGVFVVNPICPHVLTNRAVIVSDASEVEVTPTDFGSSIYLTLDGQSSHHILEGESLRITKAAHTLGLATLPGVTFFGVLQQKLKWSGTAI